MANVTANAEQRILVSRNSIAGAHLTVKDPISAGTHAMAAVASITAAPFLIMRYRQLHADAISIFAISVFIMSMILLYTASTLYHTVITAPHKEMIFKKIDHMMIFILIAGSYTPFCLITLRKNGGIALFIGVWTFAIIGIIFKFFWVTCPKWVSSTIYIAMGWLCVFAFPQFYNGLQGIRFYLLLAGGLIYTAGGIIYALNLPLFNNRHPYFGSHEIFHIFVMAGNLCHFIVVYQSLL